MYSYVWIVSGFYKKSDKDEEVPEQYLSGPVVYEPKQEL